jgi:glucokinase-like ROK family protein
MRSIHTITASEMRGINRSAILELIRREGPISRTAIASKLNVSLPTAMRIVDDLVEEDLVVPTGEKEWSGGRRRSLVRFNATGHVTIGVDLGGTKIYAAVADLGGRILQESSLPQHESAGDASYVRLAELIESLLAFTRQTDKNIRGIGIGAPGVTDHERGVVRWAPSLDWQDFPLKARLQADFGLPVIVDNDVNLAALGELWFGAGQNADNLVLIAVGTGIGAGVVIDGSIYRGSHQSAGEIGYLLPERSLLGKPYEGFGALEGLASGMGIAERARKALQANGQAAKLGTATAPVTAEDVFAAARRKEQWACGVVDETVDYLAQAVAAVSLCFDPDVIVLGGGVARSADLLIEPVLARLKGALPVPPALVASPLGYQATVMGAIINLLHNTSDFYIVRKLS